MSHPQDALLWRVKQVALRSDLRIALAKHEPVARSLERCADSLVEHLGVALAAFYFTSPSADELDLIAFSRAPLGPPTNPPRMHSRPGAVVDPRSRPGRSNPGLPLTVKLAGTLIGSIVTDVSAHASNDLAADAELGQADFVEREALTSFAGYPLLASAHLTGAMVLFARGPLAADALEVMAWVADLISITLESRRIGEELRSVLEVKDREASRRAVAQAHIALQHRVAELLATSGNFAETAPELVRELAQTLGWEVGALWRLDQPAHQRTASVWHADDPSVAELAAQLTQPQLVEAGLVAQVKKSGKPLWMTHSEAVDLGPAVPAHRSMRSAVGVPVAGDGVVGGVFLFLCREARELDEEQLRTLATIGSQVGQYLRRKLVEEQLIQSQKMEAVGKLAGGVAHDFNNILTVITGYAAMAMEHAPAGTPLSDHTHEILNAAERATSLVNQLLAFSRKQVFHPREIDLNVVVGDMERMLRRLIGEDVRLITRKPDVPSVVRADLVHIEQVIVNLAVNARDAMPQGGRLYVEISHADFEPSVVGEVPRPGVRVVVRDTGIGMNEEVRSRAFEPFFTTKGTGKGTGLGLATVYGIVRQNGGQIRVASEPGKGAQFTILFPRIVQQGASPALETPRPAHMRGHETVLLVEDEKPVRRLARNILKTAGYDVIEAASGEEALQVCAAGRNVDVLLTDVVMPGMTGVELARKLQATCPSLKVLYMSGYAEESLFEGYSLDRGVEFLEKPFTPAGLAKKMRVVLDARTGPAVPNEAIGEDGAAG